MSFQQVGDISKAQKNVCIPEPYNKWEQAWKCSECGFDDGFVAYNYCPIVDAEWIWRNNIGIMD